MIEFYSDKPGCSVYSVTAFTDAQKTTQTTTTGTYLAVNPTIRELTTGLMTLSLDYTIGSRLYPENVFLEGKTNPEYKTALSAQIQIEFNNDCSGLTP